MERGKVIPFPFHRKTSVPRRNAYTLRVFLVSGPYGEESVGQEIFRTLMLCGDQTLEDLHHAILCSYEREHDRHYEFCLGVNPNDPGGVRYTCREAVSQHGLYGRGKPGAGGRVGLAPLATIESLGLTQGQFFGYWYDQIEQWIHLIHVVSIEPVDDMEDYPLLLEKEGGLPAPVPSEAESRRNEPGPDEFGEEDFLVLLIGELQMRWRRQIENAPLNPNTRLRTALGKLPSHWVEAICRQGDPGEERRTRKACIEGLCERLPREDNLRMIWSSLPLPSREVLSWILLENQGWVKVQNLSRRFGADTDITWWWNEGQVPATPLGLLRMRGLVFVGKVRDGKRRVRIAVVPVELRKALTRIAQDPRCMEGGPPVRPSCERHASALSRNQENLLEAPVSERPEPDPWKGLESFNLRSFLSVCPLRAETEGIYAHTLGRIRRSPEAFPKRHVRELLTRMIRGRSVWSRLEAYKLGLVVLDEGFVASALTDTSRLIQQWAEEVLESPQERLF